MTSSDRINADDTARRRNRTIRLRMDRVRYGVVWEPDLRWTERVVLVGWYATPVAEFVL